jgi:hypothetical protein
MKRRWMAALAVLAVTAWLAPAAQAQGSGGNVAVAVYANEPALKKYERAVQARLEEILADSGFKPLDEAKARELRDNWVDLADPGHLITAEEIAAKAGRYEVTRVFRASFNAAAVQPLGLYHSATAQLQLRVIDREAQVKATPSLPMGTRGFPPSDATTLDAALVNALQRAVDSAAEAASLKVLAPASARVVPLVLEPVGALPAQAQPLAEAAAPTPAGWEKAAVLLAERWKREEPSCQATSPDGGYAVLGTYAWSLDRLARDNARRYGGYLHLVDVKAQKALTQLTLHELGQRGAGENGSSAFSGAKDSGTGLPLPGQLALPGGGQRQPPGLLGRGTRPRDLLGAAVLRAREGRAAPAAGRQRALRRARGRQGPRGVPHRRRALRRPAALRAAEAARTAPRC